MSDFSKNIPSANREVRMLPAGKAVEARASQKWIPLVAKDELGAGVLLCTSARSVVSPVIAALYDEWMKQNEKHGFAAVGHGMRLVADSSTGHGSPCFITKTDAAHGRIYIFALGSAERCIKAFENEGVTLVSVEMEAKGKTPGGTVTLPVDADPASVFKALAALGGSPRMNMGYRADLGVAKNLDAFDVADLPEPAPPADPSEPKKAAADGEKRGRGRPAGTKDTKPRAPRGSKKKQEEVAASSEESEENEEQASA